VPLTVSNHQVEGPLALGDLGLSKKEQMFSFSILTVSAVEFFYENGA
jgi:hypothetical protein